MKAFEYYEIIDKADNLKDVNKLTRIIEETENNLNLRKVNETAYNKRQEIIANKADDMKRLTNIFVDYIKN